MVRRAQVVDGRARRPPVTGSAVTLVTAQHVRPYSPAISLVVEAEQLGQHGVVVGAERAELVGRPGRRAPEKRQGALGSVTSSAAVDVRGDDGLALDGPRRCPGRRRRAGSRPTARPASSQHRLDLVDAAELEQRVLQHADAPRHAAGGARRSRRSARRRSAPGSRTQRQSVANTSLLTGLPALNTWPSDVVNSACGGRARPRRLGPAVSRPSGELVEVEDRVGEGDVDVLARARCGRGAASAASRAIVASLAAGEVGDRHRVVLDRRRSAAAPRCRGSRPRRGRTARTPARSRHSPVCP